MVEAPARTVTTERNSVTMTNSTTGIVFDAAARTARRYYMAVLFVWSSLSVAGNALHSLESGAGTLTPVKSAVIATLPPIALIVITHLLILQMRSSWASWKTLLTPLALMVSSFALSFTALRELAVMAGFPPILSPLMAVIIDGPVVAASAALYYDALERRKAAGSAAPEPSPVVHRERHVAAAPAPRDSVSDVGLVTEGQADHGDVATGEASMTLVEDGAESLVHDDAGSARWGSAADVVASDSGVPPRQVRPDEITLARLVRERMNTKASELMIARALMYRDQGYSQEQAAEVVGMHRTSVARWEACRDELLAQPDLISVDA